jgi:hypothetical protein
VKKLILAIGTIIILFHPLMAQAEYYHVSDDLTMFDPKPGKTHTKLITDNVGTIISIVFGIFGVFVLFKDKIFRKKSNQRFTIRHY